MYIPSWLIIAIAIGAYLVYRMKKKRVESFAPFRVDIFSKWRELLKDYKLIDDDGWKQVQEKVDKQYKENPNLPYHLLKSLQNNPIIPIACNVVTQRNN